MTPKRRKGSNKRQTSKVEPRQHQERLSKGQFSVRREIDYIVARAKDHDARCVSIGPLIFFSTETGDAWLLDPGDGLALCLASDGVPQPVNVMETADNYSIEWPGTFDIDGDIFTIAERDSGRVRSIIGYPTRGIADAIAQSRAGQSER